MTTTTDRSSQQITVIWLDPHTLADHRAGRVQVITQAGIAFTMARTWPGGRDAERALNCRHASPRLCPISLDRRTAPDDESETANRWS